LAGPAASSAAARPTRSQVLAPRSGAHPLPGSPGAPPPGSKPAGARPSSATAPPTASPPNPGSGSAVQGGTAPAARQPRTLSMPTLPFDSGGAGSQIAGGLLAVFLWPMLFNTVKGGPPQLWGWIKAKWINEAYQPGRGQGPGSAGQQSGGSLPPTAPGSHRTTATS
jgi:hypothetical protein